MINALMPTGNQLQAPALHIVHVITGLGVGGAERVLLDMASHADASQLRTSILCMTDDVSLLRHYPTLTSSVTRLDFKSTIVAAFRSMRIALAWVRREKPDLLHAHMFHGLCLALLLKLFNPRAPLVFTSHNAAGYSRLRRTIMRLSRRWRAADTVFFAGQHPELNATRTVAIQNGVSVSGGTIVRSPVRPAALLFLGRLDTQKNPLGMIGVFEAMKRTDCQLWIAGDGVDRDAVMRAIDRSPARARIRLLGVVADVQVHLSQCTALVLPSRWEGLPMVILEAGAQAVPVVATPVGAIPEVLSDDCGYLAELANFATTLDALLANRTEADARGARLQEKVRSGYSLAAMTGRFLSLYRSVLETR